MWRKEDIIEKLQKEQEETGQSLRSFANNTIGCSAAYLSDIYNGRRDPGPRILKRFGLEKKIIKTITYKERKWK